MHPDEMTTQDWIVSTRIDITHYRNAIHALYALFTLTGSRSDLCPADEYDDDCCLCRAGRMIRELESGLASAEHELQDLTARQA